MAATLVAESPEEAAYLARRAAESFDRGLDRSRVRLLRLALRALELPLAGALFRGAWRPFARLDAAGRERELRRWAESPIASRRMAFIAFKRMLAFLAYADPAPAGTPNPRLDAIAYQVAREPVAPVPTPIRALALPAAAAGSMVDLDADVVVIGSGAGGGIVARDLAAAGRSVIVVEIGPLVTEPDMPTDELSGFSRLYLDGGMTATWDGAMAILAGSCVGGGTTVNWATCIAPDGALRDEWTRKHGLEGFDGPDTDADIAGLEAELELTPPPSVPLKDQRLLDGARALGIEADATRRNAVDCGDCGSCGFGCRRGSKRSTLRVHLTEAWRAGARILPDASVRRVLISAERVRGVEADVSTPTGPRLVRIRAPQVVVAAGALRTPGILERSGVVHPSLGRFLRLQPVVAVGGLYRERIEAWRGTTQAARTLEWAPGSPAANGHAGFTVESVPAHPGLMALAFPWRSRREFADLMRLAAHVVPLIAITRDSDWGTIRQTRSGGSRIEYRLTPADLRTLRAGLIAVAELQLASGATGIVVPGEPAAWMVDPGLELPAGAPDFAHLRRQLEGFDFSPGRGLTFSAHQLGSARMGAAPGLHPIDPIGRVRWAPTNIALDRTIRGLYVADGSLFPTALGYNPMLTVMLLARLVARTMLAEAPGA